MTTGKTNPEPNPPSVIRRCARSCQPGAQSFVQRPSADPEYPRRGGHRAQSPDQLPLLIEREGINRLLASPCGQIR